MARDATAEGGDERSATETGDAGGTDTATNRRDYLRLAGAGVAVGSTGLMAGCGGDGDGDDGDDGGDSGDGGTATTTSGNGYDNVSLTFWHTEPETQRANTIAAQIEKFEEENSGVTVDAQPVDEEQIGPQTLANAQAGQIPNAIMSPTRFTHLLGEAGLLDTAAHENVIDRVGRDRFRSGPLNMCQGGEGFYAVPHDCFIEITWFRNSRFEELDLEPPETWDQHLTAAQELHNPEEDQYGISMGTGRNNITNQHFQMVALSHDAHLFNDDGELTFNTPEMVDALEFYGELAQYTPPGTATSEDNYATFLDELTYQVMQTTYMVDDIYDSGGEELLDDCHINSLLQDGEGNEGTFALTQGFNIFSADNPGISSDEVRATEDLLAFLFEPDQYIPWLHLAPGGFRPTIDGITSMDQYQDNEYLQAWDQEWQDEVTEAINSDSFGQFGFSGGNAFPEVGNITGDYLPAEAAKAVIDGDDPESVAEEYQGIMQEALE